MIINENGELDPYILARTELINAINAADKTTYFAAFPEKKDRAIATVYILEDIIEKFAGKLFLQKIINKE